MTATVDEILMKGFKFLMKEIKLGTILIIQIKDINYRGRIKHYTLNLFAIHV